MKLFIKILCSACFVAPLFSITPVFSSQNISSSAITADTLLEKAIFNDSIEEIHQAVQAGEKLCRLSNKPLNEDPQASSSILLSGTMNQSPSNPSCNFLPCFWIVNFSHDPEPILKQQSSWPKLLVHR